MFKLFRLPCRLFTLVLLVAVLAYVLTMFPNWAGEIDSSKVVQAIRNGIALIREHVEKFI
jgi:hypothetical protein